MSNCQRSYPFVEERFLKLAKIDDIKQTGVLAAQKIPRGMCVGEYAGRLLTKEEALKWEKVIENTSFGGYLFFFDKLCLDASFPCHRPTQKDIQSAPFESPHQGYGWARYFNHSRKRANLKVVKEFSPRNSLPENFSMSKKASHLIDQSYDNEKNKGRIDLNLVPRLFFYTKKDIEKNEELCFDYGEERLSVLRHHPWLSQS